MAVALAGAGVGYFQHMDCTQIMAAHVRNESAGEKAAAAYHRDQPDSKGVLAEFDVAIATVDAAHESPEMQRSVESCIRYSFPTDMLTIFGILLFALWSLAFVFGGSFWKPPAVK